MARPVKLAAFILGLTAIALTGLAFLDWNLKLIARGLIALADQISRDTADDTLAAVAAGQARPDLAIRWDPALKLALRSAADADSGIASIHIVAPDGAVLASVDSHQSSASSARPVAELQALARSAMPIGLVSALWSDTTYGSSRPVIHDNTPIATIEVGVSTAPIEAQVHALVWTGAFALTAILIAGAMLGVTTLRTDATSGSGGRGTVPGSDTGDKLEALTARFDQLSRRLKSDRGRWDSERGSFTASLRSMTDGVVLTDADGSLLFANKEARERLGLAVGSFDEGQALGALLGPTHPLVRMVEPALLAGTETRGVAFRLDESPDGRAFLVSIFPLGPVGRTAGLLILMRDLERVRELESMVEQSGHLARLGSLLSGVAHQIRKPLNVMMLQLELTRQDAESGKPLSARIERIRNEIHRLDVTIDALMRFMRPEQLKLQELDLNQLLREIGAQVNATGIRIEYELDPTLPSIAADRALLGEGLVNIVNNGIEAMEGKGVLRIGSANRGDGSLAVTVTDQGPGIALENLSKIFNLYFTTKERGSGLGLSLAARAIDMQGGSIEVASEVGRGTTFTIRLPIMKEIDVPLRPTTAA